jgi:2-isopropylmalate synthase
MSKKENNNKIFLYDTLLRDGAQTQGVDFSVNDKLTIIQDLDSLGVDYIEAGFPGANPADDILFKNLPDLKNSKIVSFGMTHKPGIEAKDDPKLSAIVNSKAEIACIFGKSWDFHATNALGISLEENLEIIKSSIKYLIDSGKEVFFDCEHFFDGYKNNQDYAIKVAKTAQEAGARWIILCDTNGGTLPHEIYQITKNMVDILGSENVGIHCHNDTENAVANSLEAVRAGARQIQGTVNGYGERCGNANIVSIIPTLKYKMDYDISINDEQMHNLKKVSDHLEEILNKSHYRHAAYVGDSAFAHKGGLHVSAVNKNPDAYEHIKPELIGNERVIVISDQAGRSNVVSRLKNLAIKASKDEINKLVDEIKKRESNGYSYDYADASFEVLVRQTLGHIPQYFEVKSFRIIDERRKNALGDFVNIAEATAKIVINDIEYSEISEGNGPVDALSRAVKKGLRNDYPEIEDISLIDFKVRIMKKEQGTGAVTRVNIEFKDKENRRWQTIGVSSNILDASYNALKDSLIYRIMKCRKVANS